MLHVSGPKIRGRHTTVIKLSETVVRLALRVPRVDGIAPGIIRSGKKASGGAARLKIVDAGTCLNLTVRQAGAAQELRVFTSDPAAAADALLKLARESGLQVSFAEKKPGPNKK